MTCLDRIDALVKISENSYKAYRKLPLNGQPRQLRYLKSSPKAEYGQRYRYPWTALVFCRDGTRATAPKGTKSCRTRGISPSVRPFISQTRIWVPKTGIWMMEVQHDETKTYQAYMFIHLRVEDRSLMTLALFSPPCRPSFQLKLLVFLYLGLFI